MPPKMLDLLAGRAEESNRTTKPCRTDVLVYTMIDALSKTGEGCFASNGYLAQQLDMTVSGIEKSVARLKAYKLITVRGSTNKRRIRVFWEKDGGSTTSQDVRELGVNSRPGRADISNTEVLSKSKSLAASRTRDRSGAKSVAIFDHLVEKPAPTKSYEDDYANATKLHTALVQANKNVRRWSVRSWALDFAKLREDVGELEITKVLLWYSGRIGNEYVPHAYSARSFRAKFDQIRDAMNRHAARNPDVSVTGKAQEIVKMLARWRWPGKCKEELPAAVQLSLDNYRPFWKHIRAREKEGDRFCGAVASNFACPNDFVMRWFDGWGRWMSNKDDFKGRLIPDCVVRLDAKDFQDKGKNLATEYGSVKLWTKLMKELEK